MDDSAWSMYEDLVWHDHEHLPPKSRVELPSTLGGMVNQSWQESCTDYNKVTKTIQGTLVRQDGRFSLTNVWSTCRPWPILNCVKIWAQTAQYLKSCSQLKMTKSGFLQWILHAKALSWFDPRLNSRFSLNKASAFVWHDQGHPHSKPQDERHSTLEDMVVQR